MANKSIRSSIWRKIFIFFNYTIMSFMAFMCALPLINVFAQSLSAPSYVAAGAVGLWPVGFTTTAYKFIMQSERFFTAFNLSVVRTILGTAITMMLTMITAYPLSKETEDFKWRSIYMWFFFFTTLFSGGLIPTYFVVKQTGLMDSIWALIIPGCVSVWNIILLLNFYRRLPTELEEAAYLDGAGHWTVLFKVFIPLSKPALATLILFNLVGNWNEWFKGMIYMQRPEGYPLQTYLRTLIAPDSNNTLMSMITSEQQMLISDELSNDTLKLAQVFVAAFPILMIYPFLQKYFATGITLGSVKG